MKNDSGRNKQAGRKGVSSRKRVGTTCKSHGRTGADSKTDAGTIAGDKGSSGPVSLISARRPVGCGAINYCIGLCIDAGKKLSLARNYQVTGAGAVLAAGIAAIALMGHVFGVREWTTLGNKVPMSASSILFIAALAYVAHRSLREEHFAWMALPLASAGWIGAVMQLTGIGLWDISPLYNLASFPALACYTLIAWGIVFTSPPVFRSVPLALAIGIAAVSAAAHWPEIVSRTQLGSQFMSLPAALAIIALAGSMLIDMGRRPFQGWRKLFPA